MTTPNEALGGPGGNAASDPLPEATGLVTEAQGRLNHANGVNLNPRTA